MGNQKRGNGAWQFHGKSRLPHKPFMLCIINGAIWGLDKRSIDDYKVWYTSYIGEGDSSSFSSLSKVDPYEGVSISKKECVCHVQNRLGSRLRTLKKRMGKTPLKDGKPIGGTSRLTDKTMNKMQCYFGQTIRDNTDNVYLMKKGLWAILWHCSEADKDAPGTRHQFCPRGGRYLV